METKPSVLVVSTSSTKPKSLIKLITKATPNEDSCPNKVLLPWKLETKYYTVDLQFIGILEDFDRDETFNENVEALIVHMDSNSDLGLTDLKKWESIETSCNPEIKLLVSNYCNEKTKITKGVAVEWCLKHGFEFIELYATGVTENDQDIIPEKIGVDRIIEALEAHVWPNLIMKEDKQMFGDNLDENVNDDFSDLFNQLHMMRDSIQSMPMRERKQCAEHIVTAFWKAIGGDEEEIADI